MISAFLVHGALCKLVQSQKSLSFYHFSFFCCLAHTMAITLKLYRFHSELTCTIENDTVCFSTWPSRRNKDLEFVGVRLGPLLKNSSSFRSILKTNCFYSSFVSEMYVCNSFSWFFMEYVILVLQ